MLCELFFLYDRIEFDELTLMVLSIVNQFGKRLSHGLDVVESRERHIAVQVGSGGTRVNGENLHGSVALLKFDSHNAHHRILGRLAGYIGQRMPVGTDL